MLKKKTAANKAVESAAQSAAARLAEQLDGNRAGPSDGGVSEVPDEQKTTEELVSKAQAVHGDTTRTAQNALRVRWGFWTMHGSCTTTLLSPQHHAQQPQSQPVLSKREWGLQQSGFQQRCSC